MHISKIEEILGKAHEPNPNTGSYDYKNDRTWITFYCYDFNGNKCYDYVIGLEYRKWIIQFSDKTDNIIISQHKKRPDTNAVSGRLDLIGQVFLSTGRRRHGCIRRRHGYSRHDRGSEGYRFESCRCHS